MAATGNTVEELARAMMAVVRAMPSVHDLQPRWFLRAPLLPSMSPPRSIAAIEAEIRRATVPALRPEDC